MELQQRITERVRIFCSGFLSPKVIFFLLSAGVRGDSGGVQAAPGQDLQQRDRRRGGLLNALRDQLRD